MILQLLIMLNSNFVMTAHVLYKKIDPNKISYNFRNNNKKIIRKKLKFKGIIISDDISMKALKRYSYKCKKST